MTNGAPTRMVQELLTAAVVRPTLGTAGDADISRPRLCHLAPWGPEGPRPRHPPLA